MARKQNIGERFEREPGEAVADVAPSAIAAAVETAKAESLPEGLKESYELLAKVSAEAVSNHAEWRLKQPRLEAIKAHIHKLGQGLPTIAPNANDHAAGWAQRLDRDNRMILKQLAYTNPAVRALLKENEDLKKQIADLNA